MIILRIPAPYVTRIKPSHWGRVTTPAGQQLACECGHEEFETERFYPYDDIHKLLVIRYVCHECRKTIDVDAEGRRVTVLFQSPPAKIVVDDSETRPLG